MSRATTKKKPIADAYDAAADSTGSYYAAIEAKRKRGDAATLAPKPAAKRRRKREDDKPAAGVVAAPSNDNPAAPTPPLDYPQWDNQVPAENDHDRPYVSDMLAAVKVVGASLIIIGAVSWLLL